MRFVYSESVNGLFAFLVTSLADEFAVAHVCFLDVLAKPDVLKF